MDTVTYRSGFTIKDRPMTHTHRSHAMEPSFNFNPEMKFTVVKFVFLPNKANKQKLPNWSIYFKWKKNEYSVIHAVLDEADVDTVFASIKNSDHHDTTVIGEVTDLNLKVKIID